MINVTILSFEVFINQVTRLVQGHRNRKEAFDVPCRLSQTPRGKDCVG